MTTYRRAFPAQLEQTAPRTLSGRLVPYGVVADVVDELPSGELDFYREGFRPQAFAPQATSGERGVLQRIGLVHAHTGGLGYLGPIVKLNEQDDGLWGDVSVLRSKASDVEDLLAAGVDELSIEFRLPRAGGTETDDDGVRWRTRAHLDQVALEPQGAYTGARVAAFRAELDALAAEEAARREAEANEAAAAEAAAAAERERLERAAVLPSIDEWLAEEAEKQRQLRERLGIA